MASVRQGLSAAPLTLPNRYRARGVGGAARFPLGVLILALAAPATASAQPLQLQRLSFDAGQVMPPSARVEGAPGEMRITQAACRAEHVADRRRRIVEIAVREWARFGFPVVDLTEDDDFGGRGRRRRGERPAPTAAELEASTRVADTIAGYWAVTADGPWILDRQNAIWRSHGGVGTEWRAPWSAAFISWVICESGLGEHGQFRRHIAHHVYIDQAIAARDDPASPAAYAAWDIGEQAIEPGDLLCSARGSAYRRIADRRRQLGIGIRSHCDIVVKLNPGNQRILGIGGNVRDAVSLKLLPATYADAGGEAPSVVSVGSGRRIVFAHLKLRAEPLP